MVDEVDERFRPFDSVAAVQSESVRVGNYRLQLATWVPWVKLGACRTTANLCDTRLFTTAEII